MQPYPPNKSAVANNYKVGDAVKWVISQTQISPYVGVVSEVCPGINKLWVEMPVGGNQQFDPSDLILVPPEQGIPLVRRNTGYSSFDKERSHQDFGTFDNPKVMKLAEKVLAKKFSMDVGTYRVNKMASDIARKYATDFVDKIASDIVACKSSGKTDIQAYQDIYKKYASKCSDGFMKSAIQKIYSLK
jgi:hypothetical protein